MSENAKFEIADTENAIISNNLIYSSANGKIADLEAFKAVNEGGLYVDPQFVGAYSDSDVASRTGRSFAENFKLKASSPAFGAASEANKVKDFFGNPYSNAVGFFCGK